MTQPLDPERVAEIKGVLQPRETEDLLAMWRANDQQEWTPEAFEAMRLILRERLHEEPSRTDDSDDDTAYFCSECGAEVALTDKFCRVCGANVEDVDGEEGEREPATEADGRVFTELELTFFGEATRLPEEYAIYFEVSAGDKILIPAPTSKVGDMLVQVWHTDIQVTVGAHIDRRFHNAVEAVNFIGDVLMDLIVFLFEDDKAQVLLLAELSDEEKLDRNAYVWSGLLRNQQTGAE